MNGEASPTPVLGPVVERLWQRLEALFGCLDRRARGWLSLLVRTWLAFDQDDGPLQARSISYFTLFSVFPMFLVIIVIASSRLEVQEVYDALQTVVTQYAPFLADLVEANIENMLRMRESVGLIALISLIWSASGVFSAVFRAVNRAWGDPKPQAYWAGQLYGLIVMFVVSALFLLSIFISTVSSLARTWRMPLLGWQPSAQPNADQLVGWVSTLVPALLSVGAFILMYRTMPRARVRWRDVWLGGLIAGLVWEAGKQLFAWYVNNVATYNLIYGSVGAIIAFLLWAYLSAQIFLLGAEFTAEYSRWRRAGRPLEARPLRQWLADWSKLESIAADNASEKDGLRLMRQESDVKS